MKVQSLHVYPVKATSPVDLESAVVEPHGLRHDRRWAVIDEHGHRLNAGHHDTLMHVLAVPDADGSLTLSAPGRTTTHVKVPRGGQRTDVDITRLSTAIDAGDAAASFFAGFLGQEARLVWQDDPARRPVSEQHGGVGGEPLSLADAGPLLLTSTASLTQLEEWVASDHEPQSLAMRRFRPNVVVDGDLEPFEEDGWRTVRIGQVDHRFAECCDRCATTTIDPETLARGKEPVRTLAKHRRWDGKTWFGVRLVPLTTGTITVGDEVTAW